MNNAQVITEQNDNNLIQCMQCKAILPVGAKFCGSCGIHMVIPDTEPVLQQHNVTALSKGYINKETNDETIKLTVVTLPTAKIRYYTSYATLRSLLTNGMLVLIPLFSSGYSPLKT